MSLYLGHDDGHFALPILRWEEIDLLVAAAPVSSIIPPSVLPLLLFATAFVGPDDDQADIRKRIADAWRQASIVDPKYADVIAHALTYRTPHAWRWDSALGWISTSEYSTRNPTSAANRFAKHDGFKWMKRVTDAAESGRPLR